MAGGADMSSSNPYVSWLAPHLLAYTRLRRATGSDWHASVGLLRQFDRHLSESCEHPPLRGVFAFDYLASLQLRSARSRDNIVSVVWPALEYARLHGAAVEPLPPRPRPAPQGMRLSTPRILSDAEIADLLTSAQALNPGTYRPATMSTLLGLMLCTGLRSCEARGLDVGDVALDERLLTVRRGKGGKQRVLPIRASVAQALKRYIHAQTRPIDAHDDSPLFVSGMRRRIAYPTVDGGLKSALKRSNIPRERWPRLHDLRHTFTVRTLARWYAQGSDIARLLPALSTFLGHVSLESTRVYLRTNAMLLEHARTRFETRLPQLWSPS